LHHVVLERWSRGSSFLHRRDARAKILALLVFLVVVAISNREFELLALCYSGLLLTAVVSARLPVLGALRRAAVVLPFSLTFAGLCWISGEPRRAALLVEKSYISALAALLLVATTPLPQLLRGLDMLGVPGFLLMVAQFLYRYLFVITEQAPGPMSARNVFIGRWSRAGSRGTSNFCPTHASVWPTPRSYAWLAACQSQFSYRSASGHEPGFRHPGTRSSFPI
jgi:cobalt/nickel transport system permease protein